MVFVDWKPNFNRYKVRLLIIPYDIMSEIWAQLSLYSLQSKEVTYFNQISVSVNYIFLTTNVKLKISVISIVYLFYK